jgi:hypothetical protein
VAIKSCLHNEKRPKIEKAFLNTKIEAYWKRIEEKFSHLDVYSYVEEEFVKSKLSNEDFGEHLRKYCQLEEIDHDMDLTFKFEFFMAEELCFNSLNHILKEEADEQGLC